MASSTIKRKETKPGDIDELSPFKRLRIYAPEKDKKEAEQSKKCNSQTEKAFRKQGQLKLSIYMNCGMLTINVLRGRNLRSKWKSQCDSFVKISLVPDEQMRTKCKTKVILDSNNPAYDDKFSFELLQEDINKRLFISVWHKDQTNCLNDHLGCMSFGILHLIKPNKRLEGWYHLLNEKTGPKKHLLVAGKQTPIMQRRGLHGIPLINKDLWGMESVIVSIERGKRGYGFSVIDACPVRVSRVDGASPASSAGLKVDDRIVRVNGKNVSRSGSMSVAKLVKSCKEMITFDIQRPVCYEILEKSPWRPGMNHNQEATAELSDLENNGPEQKKEISVDDDGLLINNDNVATSTPFPGSCDRKIFKLPKNNMSHQKADAVQRLISIESDYVSFMHSGIEQYSRPLRHCILSQKQHSTIFQNAEKLVTLSEYHLKQLQFNAPSCSSTETDDTSQSDVDSPFIQSVGLIYQSKIHMISQAYKLYAQGLSDADKTLQDLRKNPDFKKFLQESVSQNVKSSISAFIVRPSQHIKEMYQTLREIFANTNRDASDYANLKQIVEGLQLCVSYINNYTCMRALSLSSSRSSSSSQTSLSTSISSSSASSSLVHGSSSSEIPPQSSSVTRPNQTTTENNDVFLQHELQSNSRTAVLRREKPSVSSIRNLRASTSSQIFQSQSKPGRASVLSNCSEDSGHSLDSEVLNIQQKLHFPPGIPIFQLSHEERHFIYSGEMFKWNGEVWNKLQLMLFSDLLMQTEKTFDGMLTVVEAPVFLSCIQGIGMQRRHPTDFILHLVDTSGKNSKMVFRAPCIEQKYTWKSLIEQRILSNRSGSLESFVSSDISGASGVII